MKQYNKLLCTAGVVFLLAGSSLFAEGQSAKDILNKAYQHIGAMDKYAFKAVVLEDDIVDGELVKQKDRHDISVKVDRPGKVRVDTKGDIRNRSGYLNDGTFTMMDHGFGYYGLMKTPKTIDDALDFIFDKYGIKAPLLQLIYSDMDKRLKFKKSKNFGTMMVDGTECDYVAFRGNEAEVHLWITTGDKPLVKTYTIFYTTVEGHPALSTSITWEDNPKISDNDFIFTAPKDAAEISVLSTNE